MSRTALLLGASGLVGGHCLRLLLASPVYRRVLAPVRRNLPVNAPKLEQQIVDFDRLHAHAEQLAADDVFCCLGTTIRKAGSEDAFRRVDLSYPYEAARLALERGAGQYLLVSAIGANVGSRVFYNRVKGETEAAICRLPFRRIVIARPSLLLGERDESRPGERFAQFVAPALAPLLRGRLRKYRALSAGAVAIALVRLATEDERPGVRVVESDELQEVARAAGV
jgi:uncharacterized protein YbjT (DUF2867 family)